MKKLLAFVLTLTLVIGTFSFASAVPPDVVGTEYEDAVTRLGALGIMIGDDRGFRPHDSITRAEFATLVVRALGLEDAVKFSTSPTRFVDVTDAYAWAWGYINVATEQGVIKGYSETVFGPGDAVTYEQAVTMLVRALGYEPAVVGGYPAGFLAKAAELGITDDVAIAAGVGAPRGAVAQMLDNSLEVELMMRDTYGDTAEYKTIKDTSLLKTKMGVKVYEEKDVEDVDKEEREIVIDGDTLQVADGIIIDGLLNAKVTAWKYKGKIVYISTDSRIIYDSIDDDENKTRNDRIALYNVGKTYRTTIDVDEVNNMADGQYGRFIINNSRITDAVLYDMTYIRGGVVTSVSTSKEEIKYFVGSSSTRTLRLSDADDITVIRDHQVASLGDIEEDDVIFVDKTGDDYFIVATSSKEEGTLTRVTGSAVYVDRSKINETAVGTGVYYSTDNGDKFSRKSGMDDYDDLLGEDVTVYKDYEGRAIYVVGDVDGVTSDWNYAVFIKYASDINGDLVRLVNSEGKIITYRVAEDATIKDANNAPISLDDIAEKSIIEVGDVFSGDLAGIRYKLNRDGEIRELQELIADAYTAEADVSGTDKNDDTITVGGDTLFVTSSTGIFKIEGTKNTDIMPVKWTEIKNAKSFTGVKAAVYKDSSKSLAKLIIITNKFNQLSDDTVYYGYVTSMGKISADKYELEIDLGEDEVGIVFDKGQIGSGVSVDTVVRYRLNNAGNGVSAVKQTGEAKHVYDVDGYFLKFYGDSTYTKVSEDVVVYDYDGEKCDYGDIEDSDGDTANKIRIFKNEAGVIEAIIIEDYTANLVPVDKTALNGVIAVAQLLEETDYTAATWEDVDAALAVAIAVRESGNATQEQVNAASSALNDAIAALEFAGQAALDAAKTSAGALQEADYTPESWAVLTAALALPETTNAEVVAKTTAINDAIAALEFAGQAALDAAKASAGALQEADYTPESWAVLTAALALPETTNAEVVAKTTAINDAIAALEFAGQAALDAAKASAGALQETDYTPESWAVLTAALVLPETTNAEVVAKTTAINDAIAALEFAGQAALDAAKTSAGALQEADYTPESWAVLTAALALPETTNAEVVAKTTAINDAIAALVAM